MKVRRFTPMTRVPRVEHVGVAQPSTIPWSKNPADSTAIYRPPRCTSDRCHERPMIWWRCRCRHEIARCFQHEAPQPLATARATHEAACPSR